MQFFCGKWNEKISFCWCTTTGKTSITNAVFSWGCWEVRTAFTNPCRIRIHPKHHGSSSSSWGCSIYQPIHVDRAIVPPNRHRSSSQPNDSSCISFHRCWSIYEWTWWLQFPIQGHLPKRLLHWPIHLCWQSNIKRETNKKTKNN